MSETAFLVSEPKQGRSRASLQRLIEACVALLEQHGNDDFTLLDVSKLAKVSIGSIYGRVSSKDDLIRIVQSRVNERLEREQAEMLRNAAAAGSSLDRVVPILVEDIAEFLRQHQLILRALMARAVLDTVVSAAGKKSYAKLSAGFQHVVLEYRKDILHPRPQRAVAACFSILSAALSRNLGLGNSLEAADGSDWRELKTDLSDMCLAFLMSGSVPVGKKTMPARTSAMVTSKKTRLIEA